MAVTEQLKPELTVEPQSKVALTLLPDPRKAAHEDFYAYTKRYLLRSGAQLRHSVLGKLVVVQGLPEGLVEVDAYRSGIQTTSLSLDVQNWRMGTFIWHIDSNGLSIEHNRRLTVSEDTCIGEIDYRRLIPAPGGGTSEQLGAQAISSLIDVTYNLAEEAFVQQRDAPQQQLPFWPYI